ncbi:hypothetical protein A5819_003665 [Enterococcus sp. 7E2_DIV0204]|uniref:WxL domain-containing protein n=1 Tax=unclassified Enterococcus TaxID=2608891 RepID=UPI000A34D3CC|nr:MULTISPECIES: WxL domain-containing protein [unclassified Enterococcus]OTN83846.1 hypothetical protein A5819_003665 [Enterococcus sp. 7E2_DIV0204]OTP47512.1 hypothetical protein A5884_003483 [Enterococcus sp. 7D2_DIV0200]
MKKKVVCISLLSATLLCSTLVGATTLAAELGSEGSIKYYQDNGPTDPVDPIDPDPTDPVDPGNPDPGGPDPEPGTPGPLSLDFVPHLYFGLNKITNKTVTYESYSVPIIGKDGKIVDYKPNYVQVSDKRDEYSGWSLKVEQTDEFTNESKKTLGEGTEIKFTSPVAKGVFTDATAPSTNLAEFTVTPNGESQTFWEAKANEGEGTWVNAWGQNTVQTDTVLSVSKDEEGNITENRGEANIDKAITLTVPGTIKKEAQRYVTNLKWTLTDAPE